MNCVYPESREQLIMPSSIDDCVSFDNPVCFIDVIVHKTVQIQPELLSGKGTSDTGR